VVFHKSNSPQRLVCAQSHRLTIDHPRTAQRLNWSSLNASPEAQHYVLQREPYPPRRHRRRSQQIPIFNLPLPSSISVPNRPITLLHVSSKTTVSQQLPFFSLFPQLSQFLHGTLAQRCNTDLGARYPHPQIPAATAGFAPSGCEVVAGADDLAAIALEHQLLQRHRPPSCARQRRSAAGQRGAGGVLLRRRYPDADMADCRRRRSRRGAGRPGWARR
jgi:hypothetical protein